MPAGTFRVLFDIFLITLGPKKPDFAKSGGSNFSKYKALDASKMPAGTFRVLFDIFLITLGPKKPDFAKSSGSNFSKYTGLGYAQNARGDVSRTV